MPATLARGLLTLREWEPRDVYLPAEDAIALQGSAAGVTVETLAGGKYRLSPTHIIGSLPLPRTDVVIQPKIGVRRVLFLLGYARNLRFRADAVPVERSADLTEALVHALLGQARLSLRRGPLRSYRRVDDSLPTVRGRIRLLDQARRRFALPLPLEVTYDDFTVDIEENRLLKAALLVSQRMRLRDATLCSRIREILGNLTDVTESRYDRRALPTIGFTRLNRHYQQTLSLARLILASATADLAHGAFRVPAFLIDMDKVFEDFVFAALGDALHLAGMRWAQGRSMTLDVDNRVRIKPDLSLWSCGACRFVGDVKYKATGFGEHEDLYQTLAYARAAGLEDALLIYASAAKTADSHLVRHGGPALHVRHVDLEAADAEILEQIKGLAGVIRRLAA